MDILSAVILGIIQGAAEFLPVSSSAHLALCHAFFGVISPEEYPGFDVFLHLGTLISVCFAYRSDVPRLFKGYIKLPYKLIKARFRLENLDVSERTAAFTVFAVIPVVIAALCGADGLADTVAAYPALTGAALIINGFLLLLPDRTNGKVTIPDVKYGHAFGAGLFQALAVIPGISRSGATVTGAALAGVKREDAVKLSFLCSIPAVIGACVLKLPGLLSVHFDIKTLSVYGVGALTAALCGFSAVKLIVFISGRRRFKYFSFYCFAVGLFSLIRGFNC